MSQIPDFKSDTEAREFLGTLKADLDELRELKAATDASRAAVTGLTERLKSAEQLIDAQARALTSASPDAPEMRVYTEIRDEHKACDPSAYVEADGRTVRMYGHQVRSGEEVGYIHGLLDDPNPANEAVKALQEAVERRNRVRMVLRAARKQRNVATPASDFAVYRAALQVGGGVEKIFADSAAIGAEFIREQIATRFEDGILSSMTGAMSLIQTYNHPGGTLKVPYAGSHLQVFKRAIPTSDDPSNDTLSSLSTGNNSIDTVHSVVGAQFDRDATEDAIIAYEPIAMAAMMRAFADADGLSFHNGDTAGTQDTIASWDPRGRMPGAKTAAINLLTRWDGTREVAGDASTTVDLGSAQTYAGLLSLVELLGIEQYVDGRGSRLAMFLTPEWYLTTGIYLAEFQSHDKVGMLAAYLTGSLGSNPGVIPNQVGTLLGTIPVALDYGLTADLNASGVYDNVTTTKGGAVLVDIPAWEHWVRRGAMVEQDVEIRNNTVTLVARKRSVLRKQQLRSGQAAAAFGYNLTTT